MIRIAIVGCGSHSEGNHARPLAHYVQEHPDELELVAACDLRLDRAEHYCQAYGFARAYEDMDAMLDEEQPDGVVCILRQPHVVPMGIKLLERGQPCVIEKPLGISPEETQQLLDVAEQTGTPHMVSVNRRFAPYLNRALGWSRERGSIHYIRGCMHRHARAEETFIWETGIHVTDAVRYLGGEVVGFGVEVMSADGLSADWFLLRMRFASGAIGCVEILPTDGMDTESYELFGEGYRARAIMPCGPKAPPAALTCWAGRELAIDEQTTTGNPEWLANGAYDEVGEFVRLLRDATPPRATVSDVAASMRLVWEVAGKR